MKAIIGSPVVFDLQISTLFGFLYRSSDFYSKTPTLKTTGNNTLLRSILVWKHGVKGKKESSSFL
jgi:hypothetical protein